MPQIIRQLVVLGITICSINGYAGSIDGDLNISFESVGVEAAIIDGIEVDLPAGVIVINPDSDLSFGNRLRLRLDNNAVFKDSAYVLEQSNAGAATGDISQFALVTHPVSGSNELEFRVADSLGINSSHEYILSGSSVTGAPVNFHVPSLPLGGTINISGEIADFYDVLETLDTVKLFEYFDEFSGSVATLADATIDRLSSRTKFLNESTVDVITLNLNDLGVDHGTVLGKRDVVDITLTGDLNRISEIQLTTDGVVRGTFEIAENVQSATFRARASDVLFSSITSITTKVSGEDKLATRRFGVQADLSLLNSIDKTLIAANTFAGAWSYDGYEAKVPAIVMNEITSSVSFVFTNESRFEADVEAVFMWNLDGVNQDLVSAELGTIPNQGVLKVSESTILEALGDPNGTVEVFITFIATGQSDQVQLVAERVGSDGRQLIPVFYNTKAESFRSWLQ